MGFFFKKISLKKMCENILEFEIYCFWLSLN
jgi:hypothetical protein